MSYSLYCSNSMNQDAFQNDTGPEGNVPAPRIPVFDGQMTDRVVEVTATIKGESKKPSPGIANLPIPAEALSELINKITQADQKTADPKAPAQSVVVKPEKSVPLKTDDQKPANASSRGGIKENKKSRGESPFLQRSLILIGVVAFCLIPIIPKQAGGDIEISGAPVGSQALIRPSLTGTLASLPVRTNQRVRKGQIIAVLKNWELEEKLLNAKRQLAQTNASMGTLEAQIEVASEEYQKAKEFYNRIAAENRFVQANADKSRTKDLPPRLEATAKQYQQLKLQAESLSQKASLYKTLAEEGVFPKQTALQSAYEAVAATKQAEALKSQLDAETGELREAAIEDFSKLRESDRSASSNLKRIGTIKTEINVKQKELQGLAAEIALFEKELESLTLRSPINGVILTLNTELLAGQNFNRGETIVSIGELNRRVKVTLQLPEEDRAYIARGMKVGAHIRAVPNHTFKGVVAEIAPVNSETGENTNKRRISEVTMFLDNPSTKEKPNGVLAAGMTGYARIETKKTNSLFGLVIEEIYKAFRLDRFI